MNVPLSYLKAIIIADFIQDLEEGDYETAAITFNVFYRYYRSITKARKKRIASKLDKFI